MGEGPKVNAWRGMLANGSGRSTVFCMAALGFYEANSGLSPSGNV